MGAATTQPSNDLLEQFGRAQYAIMQHTNRSISGIQSTMYVVYKCLCEKLQKADFIRNQAEYNIAITARYNNAVPWNGQDLLDWLSAVSYDISEIAGGHPAFRYFQEIIEEAETFLTTGASPYGREDNPRISLWKIASLCSA